MNVALALSFKVTDKFLTFIYAVLLDT